MSTRHDIDIIFYCSLHYSAQVTCVSILMHEGISSMWVCGGDGGCVLGGVCWGAGAHLRAISACDKTQT